MKQFSPLILMWFVIMSSALAFPPAPYYTLYGMIRDQVGQSVVADGVELVLFKGDNVAGRTAVVADFWIDHNYELNIRLDANRPNTRTYSSGAILSEGEFSLMVEMNGFRFYPIEASGTLTAGMGGERVRLDLTLGEDTDGDGLPDIWEQWQLYQAGFSVNEDGSWPIELIDRAGDFDGDGQNNFVEYLAGTFAGDASESLVLEVRDKLPDYVRFEFYAITGKTYTIERSSDMINWVRVPFSMDVPGPGLISHRAEQVGIRSVYAASATDAGEEFYRLSVR